MESVLPAFRFNWSGVYMFAGSIPELLPPGGDFSICKTAKKYCYVCPPMGEQDRAPRLPLTVCFSLVCLFLSSLINNCLNLPIGTYRRSCSWMKTVSYNQKWGTKALCPESPEGPAQFHQLYSLIPSSSSSMMTICLLRPSRTPGWLPANSDSPISAFLAILASPVFSLSYMQKQNFSAK